MNYSKTPFNKPIKYQYLTRLNVCSYAESASAKSDVSFSRLKLAGALAPMFGAFLYLFRLWRGMRERLLTRRLPVSGTANPVCPAALLFSSNGGGFLTPLTGEASC
jgi:hypothetical protein